MAARGSTSKIPVPAPVKTPQCPRCRSSLPRAQAQAAKSSTAATTERQAKQRRQPPRPFRCRHFNVHHHDCGMKVGTDAFLLGSWARPTPATLNALDVGTGSGVLALMLAQRSAPHACIHAIDVDEAACRQAAGNVAASPWAGRMHVFHMGLQELVNSAQDADGAYPTTTNTFSNNTFSSTSTTTSSTNTNTNTPHQQHQPAGQQDQPAGQQHQPACQQDQQAGSVHHHNGPEAAEQQPQNRALGVSDQQQPGREACVSSALGVGDQPGREGVGQLGREARVLPASAWRRPPGGYDLIVSNPPYFLNSYLPDPSTGPVAQQTGGQPAREQPASQPAGGQPASEQLASQPAAGMSASDQLVVDTATFNTGRPAMEGEAATDCGPSVQGGGVPGSGQGRDTATLRRTLARHAGAGTALTYEVLAQGAASLLAPEGELYVVLPVDMGEATRFEQLAQGVGLTLVRYLQVYSTPESPTEKRRLMHFKNHAPTPPQPNQQEPSPGQPNQQHQPVERGSPQPQQQHADTGTLPGQTDAVQGGCEQLDCESGTAQDAGVQLAGTSEAAQGAGALHQLFAGTHEAAQGGGGSYHLGAATTQGGSHQLGAGPAQGAVGAGTAQGASSHQLGAGTAACPAPSCERLVIYESLTQVNGRTSTAVYTREYMTLTWDMHHPEFFDKWGFTPPANTP